MPSTLVAGRGCARPRASTSHAGESRGHDVAGESELGREVDDGSAARRERLGRGIQLEPGDADRRDLTAEAIGGLEDRHRAPARARRRATTSPATPAPITITRSAAGEGDAARG